MLVGGLTRRFAAAHNPPAAAGYKQLLASATDGRPLVRDPCLEKGKEFLLGLSFKPR